MHVYKQQGKRRTVWYARVELPADPVTGMRRRKRVSAPTRKEVERQAREILHAAERGGYVDGGRLPLRDFLEKWLEDYGRGAWEPTVWTTNAGLVRNHVVPTLGQVKLEKLTAADINALYRQKLKEGRLDGKPGGLSNRTVRYIHSLVKQALSHAVKWGLILHNVADAVDPPKRNRPEMRTWDAQQVAHFLDAARDCHYYPVYVIALLSGMRRGEILGLRWQDVDLERAALTIQQTLKDDHGRLYFGAPKTHRSKRPVALTADTVAFLRSHKARQNKIRLMMGDKWEDNDLVLTTETGRPIHPTNMSRRYRQVVESLELPFIRFHDLRHTHATLLLNSGENLKVVSERLGHASTAFTMDTYYHPGDQMQREVAERLNEKLKIPGV